jgi:LysM repeat protein
MDKQNIISEIPVNTRTVGTPGGIYILYLEDYVYTFIKKIISDKINTQSTNKSMQPDIALYGRQIEENGRYKMVVSGAALSDGDSVRIKCQNDTYFPKCSFLCMAYIEENKDNKPRIELVTQTTHVVLDDYYIYYDQNEEMQNYLIEWNEKERKNETPDKINELRTKHNDRDRDSAVRYGRIVQAYNKEGAKVGFMWNVMNVLCLGFVVCFMAYGIIMINNYNKMQNMQENIDYCMSFITEKMESVSTAKSEPLPAITVEEQSTSQPLETNTYPQKETLGETTDEALDGSLNENADVEETETEQTQALEVNAQSLGIPQYYVIQKGDTLRNISFSFYGDYEHVNEICQMNNIENPDNILYGQKLLLP